MLTLSNIATRIEQLEQETYHDENDRLSTWFSMVKWQYFIYLHGDSWHDAFEKLPKDDEIKKVYNSLMWFPIWKFTDVLPATGDNWLSEKVQISLSAWLEEGFYEGYSQEALSSPEAMNDCLKFVSDALINGDWTKFHEQKRKEYETWELKLKYRRQAHEGSILPDGIKWLEEHDTAFWLNLSTKKETTPEVKPLPIALPPALPEAIPPQEIIQPVANGPVRLKYIGGWRGFNITTIDGIRAIEPGDTVTVPPFVWTNIVNGVMPKNWWVKL